MTKTSLWLVIASLSCLFFLGSCSHLQYLDAAKESFNQGASLENEIRFATTANPSISPAYYYNRAYASVNEALKGNRDKKLMEDHLLGHAYSLKALCEWKLGDYDEAITTGNLAKSRFIALSDQGIELPRDIILMKSLPAIITIDTVAKEFFGFRQSRLSTNFDKSLKFYKDYIFSSSLSSSGALQEAIRDIETLKPEASNNPELYAYLVMVQLSALKTWNACLSMLFEKSIADLSVQEQMRIRREVLDEKQEYLNLRKTELLNELERALGEEGTPKDKVLAYWNAVL